jgi:hypothetical protein
LCSPRKPNPPRYIGSTLATAEERAKDHREHRKAKSLLKYNSGLAHWLQRTTPVVVVLAEVSEDQRFDVEAELTRQLRQQYKLLNIMDGRRHTEESRKRIRQGMARAKARS